MNLLASSHGQSESKATQMVSPEPSAPSATPSWSAGQDQYPPNDVSVVSEDTLHIPSVNIFPTGTIAEHFYRTFRDTHLRWFPFLVFPADMDAEKLRRTRPILWKIIMYVGTTDDIDLQTLMATNIIHSISIRMLLQNEKSLHLIQSTVIFAVWLHHYYLINPQVINLLHLSQAMLVHLGVTRDPCDFDRRPIILEGVTDLNGGKNDLWRGVEETRMLAGCFVACVQ